MIIKSVLFILVISQIESNGALKDDTKSKYLMGKSHKYNHLPLFEEYRLSLDADESKFRKVRQVESAIEEKQNSDEVIKPVSTSLDSEENLTSTPILLTSSSKIPVSATDNSTVLQSNKTSNNTNKTKKRKRTRQPNQTKNENTTERLQRSEDFSAIKQSTSTTQRVPITSQGPRTIVPKVFTKRPPEDNPVVKNVRQRDPVVKILKETNYVFAHNGNFRYSFEGADGTIVSSKGELKSFDDDKTGEAVVGSVSYTDNDGNDFNLSYTADENGYRPQGAHLPTPPPIPPAIARALAYLATKTTPQPVTEPIS